MYNGGMNREDIIRVVRAHRRELDELGVERIRLFGSFARDDADAGSDVDFVVRLRPPPSLRSYMRVTRFLESILGRRVDVATERQLRGRFAEAVADELVDVA